MQIQTIHAFLTLCRIQNITKCSELLKISQQGLSRQIRSMEQELGVTLFEREPRGVRLTPQGELLRPYLEKSVSFYEAGLQNLERYDKERARDLNIVICPGIHAVLGTKFFLDFDHAHPDINLHLQYVSDPEAENALIDGRADGAFLDWPEHTNLYDMYQIVHSRLVAVMRPDHPLAGRKEISFQDLRGEKCFFPDETHRKNQQFRLAYPDIYYSLDRSYISNDYENYVNLPRELGGIALCFEITLRNLDPGLVVIPFKEDSYVSLFYCIRNDHPMDAALRAFSDYIYSQVDVIAK